MDHSPPSSSVHGILQARILEWAALPPPTRDLSNPGIEPMSPALPILAGGFLTTEPRGKPLTVEGTPPHIYRSALPSPSLEPSLWKHLIGRELGPACLDHAQTVGSRKSRTLTATWVPHLRPPSQRPSPRNQHHPHQLPQGCMGRLEHPLPATARKQGQERPG